ncbi:TolC family protein [bacterium]|nr:TolC family protein [bacterium]
MKKIRSGIIGLILMVSGHVNLCATSVGEAYANASLDQLVAHALEHNGAINAAHRQWEASLEKVPQARSWPDPKLNYGVFMRSVETRVGPQQHKIGIMQPIPWFGLLKAAERRASAEAAAAYAHVKTTQLHVVRDVKDLWHELAWIEEALRVTGENIQLVKQLEGVAQARFRAGSDLGAVTKAQIELGKLEDRKAAFEDLRAPYKARLNALLDQDSAGKISFSQLVPNKFLLPEESILVARQKEANPLLLQLAHRLRKETYSIAYARKQGLPDLGFGIDYIATGKARSAGVRDSGKDAAVAMFSISIPLWRGKYKAMVKEAEANRDAVEATRADLSRQLEADLRMALYRFRDAGRKIELYGVTLLPQSRSSLKVARRSYETGKGGFLDLVDAQRVLLEIELERWRALADQKKALALIEMLVGGFQSEEEGTKR